MASRPRDPDASDDPSDAQQPQRRVGRRRTYNRRHDDTEVAPPYFETFDRIATALEQIEQLLRDRPVRLPDSGSRARADNL